jgi:prolyl-tRNA synthetase
MEMTENVIHMEFCVPFLFFKRPQWDKFAGAEDTYAADTLMPDGRALQLPSTHMLGQNFSKSFGIKYMDESGKEEYVWQTCYGPAISRIYAALIATHGDEKGLVLPFDLAPLQIVIIPIFREDTRDDVLAECRKLKEELSSFSVRLDETENTPGFKFNHWELKGVPVRIEIGPRDISAGQAVLVRRDTKEKTIVKREELKERIRETAQKMKENLKAQADEWFSEKLSFAETMDELEEKIQMRGFVRVPFCSDGMDAKPCADILKERFQVNMRGSLFGTDMEPDGKKCIACGKDAAIHLYAAHQY